MTTAIIPSSPAMFCSAISAPAYESGPDSLSWYHDPPNYTYLPPIHDNPLDEPSPLGLTLRKTPSLLELISSKLSQESGHGRALVPMEELEGEGSDTAMVDDPNDATAENSNKLGSLSAPGNEGALLSQIVSGGHFSRKSRISTYSFCGQGHDKKKASNFHCSSIKIGSWEKTSRFEGELVAKCYYAKRKLVWEVLENGLKTKIEVQWGDISALRAAFPQDSPATLEIELMRPPLFFEETNPQPKKHTLWQAASDFTEGQASTCRRHLLTFPNGALNKPFQNLIESDPRLRALVESSLTRPTHVDQSSTPPPIAPSHSEPPPSLPHPYAHTSVGDGCLYQHQSRHYEPSHYSHYSSNTHYDPYDEFGYGYPGGPCRSVSHGLSTSSSMTDEGYPYSCQHIAQMEACVPMDGMQPYAACSPSLYTERPRRCESCTGSACSDDDGEQSQELRSNSMFDPMDLFSGAPCPSQDYSRYHEMPLYIPGSNRGLTRVHPQPVPLMPYGMPPMPSYLQPPAAEYYWGYSGMHSLVPEPTLDYEGMDNLINHPECATTDYGQTSLCSTTFSTVPMPVNPNPSGPSSDGSRQTPPPSHTPSPESHPSAHVPTSSHGSITNHSRVKETGTSVQKHSSAPSDSVPCLNRSHRTRGRPRIASPPMAGNGVSASRKHSHQLSSDARMSEALPAPEQMEQDAVSSLPPAASETSSAARVRVDVKWDRTERARDRSSGKRGWANEQELGGKMVSLHSDVRAPASASRGVVQHLDASGEGDLFDGSALTTAGVTAAVPHGTATGTCQKESRISQEDHLLHMPCV